MKNSIVFAQAQDNNKAVVATRDGKEVYLAWTLKQENEKIYGNLGGKRREGVKYFCVDFPTVKNAKEFIAQAITEMSKKEYNATRKAAEGNKKPKTSTKGNGKSPKGNKKSARKGKGDVAPTKAVTEEVKETKKTTKGKGNAELTEAGKKALDRMKASVLNRAASAYSIANGGEATTFKALGKSAKDLSAYIPKAKENLLKSDKWAKASEAHGLTEDMLG